MANAVAIATPITLVTWGGNGIGQTTIPAGLSEVTAIAAGGSHTVALKSDGTVLVLGDNSYGQTTIPAGLSGVTAIAAGDAHTVALKSNGTVVAWGLNGIGQTTIPAGLSGVTAVAAGGFHTVALKSDGTVTAWGDNSGGQTTIPAGLSEVTAIAAGDEHTVALKSNGTVVAWGSNRGGETTIPAGLSGVKAIAARQYETAALTSNSIAIPPPDYPQVIYKSVGNQTIFGNGKVAHITAKGFLVLSSGVTFGYPVKATAIAGFTLNGLKLFSVVPLENYRWDTYSGANGATYSTMAKAESPGTQFDGVLLEAVYLRGKNTTLNLGPTASAFMPRTFFSSARSIGLNSQTGIKTVGEVTGSYVFDQKATAASNQLETYDEAVTRLSNGFAGRGYTQFFPPPAQ